MHLQLDAAGPIFAHNEIAIGGWAQAPTGIASVSVRIGARELPAIQQADGARTRFEVSVDSSDWERGEHPLEVVATDRDGAVERVTSTIDLLPYDAPPLGEAAVQDALASGAAAMWYEAPELAGGVVTDEHPEVRGWATAADGIAEVLVTIDDRLRLRAIHGLNRSDLRAGFGEEVAASCGFALRLDPSELPVGPHVVTIVAVTGGGAAIGIAGTVERVDAPGERPPTASLEAPPARPAVDHLGSGERYVPELHRGMSLEPEHHARYRWAAPMTQGRTVLDAGCGVGWGTALLAERAERAIGVDISPLAISESERRHGDVAEFQLGDLCELPFDDQAFDAVISFEAIEHVADPDRALDELRRVLRPDGLLLVSSPNRGVYEEGNPFHLRELTSEELQQSLESRFLNVAIYRQQTYLATLLGPDSLLELDDPEQALEATTTKLVGGPPGSELYAVAAASDAPLPELPAHLALGGDLDRGEHLRMLEPWQDRARRAEIELARARAEARRRSGGAGG